MKPLITFIALAYNQEHYIREAVNSAFSQTYSPLEIIFCDDCSTDNTFEIITEMARNYKGSHAIILNRNKKTLGIGGNINRAMELGHGELFVVAAGDDISLPIRCEVVYQAWEESGRKATSLFSSTLIMGEEGGIKGVGGLRETGTENNLFTVLSGDLCNFLSWRDPVVNGCSHAWSPSIFKYFGPLRSNLEDLVLSFRTLAIGQMIYINEPTVKYRRHEANASFLAEYNDTKSFEHRESRLLRVDEKSEAAFINILFDIETLYRNRRITSKHRDQLNSAAKAVCGFYAMERQMMCGSFFEKLLYLASAVFRGEVRLAFRFTPRLLPKKFYRKLYMLRDGLRASGRIGQVSFLSK